MLCELDGTVFDRPIAAFRVVPYEARTSISLPDNFTDIDEEYLKKMQDSKSQGDEEEEIEEDDSESEEEEDDREDQPVP